MLQVTNLSKTFTVHQLQRAVGAFDDLSFTLAAGELKLVRGPNGVGKSTLLRCLYRTYLPSAGSAVFQSLHGPIDLARAADIDIAHLRRGEIGHVTQFLRPRPRVSALAIAAEPLLQHGMPAAEAQRAAEAALTAFGLKSAIWGAYPATFSGGEQQKVNLAAALIRPPRLLLLDEPTASLDSTARAALLSRLRELKHAGVAMLAVFHHVEDIAPLVDAEIVLSAPTGLDELAEHVDSIQITGGG
jgi:alpha-D-ribose 1-methylphosphonate 5-triphosphate synthase subunit PhnL